MSNPHKMAKSSNNEAKDYISLIVYLFIGLGSFIAAILIAFFGGTAYYYGQTVVTGDVFTGAYKYQCLNLSQSASSCTSYNTSAETPGYTAYSSFVGQLNTTVPLYIDATSIAFGLLGIVFLVAAFKSLPFGEGSEKREEM